MLQKILPTLVLLLLTPMPPLLLVLLPVLTLGLGEALKQRQQVPLKKVRCLKQLRLWGKMR